MVKTTYYRGRVQVMSRGGSVSIISKTLAIIAVMLLAFTTLFATTAKPASATDNWFVNTLVCGNDLGLNTAWNPRVNLTSPDPTEETTYNKLTLQDMYGDRLSWTTFNGTQSPKKLPKDKGNILRAGGTADSTGVASRLNGEISKASDDAHDLTCSIRSAWGMITGTILGTAGAISNFTSLFVTMAVDPNFICQDPANPQGMCINLLGVIAGDGATGSDGGIIGRLYNGMYSGLCIIVFAAVGVWAAWTGLMKRKLTSALGGIAWAVIIFGVGVIFMVNPLLLAKAPMQIGTSLGGCVVMGMNGQNCLSTNTGTHQSSTNSKNTECYVDEEGQISATRAMALSAKMASCKVWKAFVFEPWVAGQFGTSYDELFTGGDSSKAGPLFQNSKTKDNLEYWKNIKVGLYTSNQKMNNVCKDTAENKSSYYYSNVALYQLNLMSDPAFHACNVPYHRDNGISTDDNVYGDWIWILDAMSQARSTKDQSGADNLSIMWASWTGDNYWGRLSVALISLISSFLGGLVLITTAVLAMVYLFMSVLLTAFAPLFFLIGIMPGQGKKLFLGWVEKLLSNTLKYFGCILWMMVTLELYAAVLGNTNSNLGMTFIFSIIVTLSMWLYRGEFLKMIGKANLGGTQMSNAVSDWAKGKASSVAQTAASAAAGAAGGFLAGRSAPKVKKGDIDPNTGQVFDRASAHRYNMAHGRLAAARDSGNYQVMQSLKAKSGVVGAAARTKDRIDDARRRETHRDIDTANKRNKAVVNELRDKLIADGWRAEDIDTIMRATGGDPRKYAELKRKNFAGLNINPHNIPGNDAQRELEDMQGKHGGPNKLQEAAKERNAAKAVRDAFVGDKDGKASAISQSIALDTITAELSKKDAKGNNLYGGADGQTLTNFLASGGANADRLRKQLAAKGINVNSESFKSLMTAGGIGNMTVGSLASAEPSGEINSLRNGLQAEALAEYNKDAEAKAKADGKTAVLAEDYNDVMSEYARHQNEFNAKDEAFNDMNAHAMDLAEEVTRANESDDVFVALSQATQKYQLSQNAAYAAQSSVLGGRVNAHDREQARRMLTDTEAYYDTGSGNVNDEALLSTVDGGYVRTQTATVNKNFTAEDIENGASYNQRAGKHNVKHDTGYESLL